MISIICALTANHAIGYKGSLLYHLPADLKHFKELTTGHTVVMGRKTFESLPKGALPHRRNIVITRQADYQAPGIEVFHCLEAALQACQTDTHIYIIGGESIYKEALPYADRMCLTHIEATASEADTYFPSYEPEAWVVESDEPHLPDEKNALPYRFTNYIRKQS